jgi:hypothetical protein
MTMAAFRRFDPYAVLGENKHLDREGLASLAGLAAAGLENQNRAHMLTIPDFALAEDNQDREVTPAKVAKSAKPTLTWGDLEAKPAAIVGHDGCIPIAWAEGLARLDPDRPPGDVPTRRWLTFIDDIGQFLDSPFCAIATALGWRPLDLFGCDRDRPFARIDQAGLLWLLNGDRLLALTENTAAIQTRTGAGQTYHRKPSDPGRVLAWELT